MKVASMAVMLAVAHLLGSVAARAETIPSKGIVDSRVRVVNYNPEDVVKLHGYVGYQIHMQWAEGERFANLGAGDANGLDVGVDGNHFFLKPKQEKLGTNLTILTNRRAYHFDYSVSKAPPGGSIPKDMVYSVRFTYPQDETKQATADSARRRTEARLAQGSAYRTRNMDYWFCGPSSIKPLMAFDDGVQTRLKFASRAELPAIFVKNDDDSEALLNFNVEQDEVVIHRTARRLVLRRGQLVGCVVNRSFDGSSERLKTNVVAPGLVRETQGAFR